MISPDNDFSILLTSDQIIRLWRSQSICNDENSESAICLNLLGKPTVADDLGFALKIGGSCESLTILSVIWPFPPWIHLLTDI